MHIVRGLLFSFPQRQQL